MIKELATGLGVTLENLFKKPFTVQYPEEKLDMFPRFRGLHILTRHADGLERCVGASCARWRARRTRSSSRRPRTIRRIRSSHGERYAERYEINMLRCIFCGMCEEACPEDAIYLEKDYELSDTPAIRSSTRRPSSWCRWRSRATSRSAEPSPVRERVRHRACAARAQRLAGQLLQDPRRERAHSQGATLAGPAAESRSRSAAPARSLRIARRRNHGWRSATSAFLAVAREVRGAAPRAHQRASRSPALRPRCCTSRPSSRPRRTRGSTGRAPRARPATDSGRSARSREAPRRPRDPADSSRDPRRRTARSRTPVRGRRARGAPGAPGRCPSSRASGAVHEHAQR